MVKGENIDAKSKLYLGPMNGAFYQVRQMYSSAYNVYSQGYFRLAYYDRTADWGPGGSGAWSPNSTVGLTSYGWYGSSTGKEHQDYHWGYVPIWGNYNSTVTAIGD